MVNKLTFSFKRFSNIWDMFWVNQKIGNPRLGLILLKRKVPADTRGMANILAS